MSELPLSQPSPGGRKNRIGHSGLGRNERASNREQHDDQPFHFSRIKPEWQVNNSHKRPRQILAFRRFELSSAAVESTLHVSECDIAIGPIGADNACNPTDLLARTRIVAREKMHSGVEPKIFQRAQPAKFL